MTQSMQWMTRPVMSLYIRNRRLTYLHAQLLRLLCSSLQRVLKLLHMSSQRRIVSLQRAQRGGPLGPVVLARLPQQRPAVFQLHGQRFLSPHRRLQLCFQLRNLQGLWLPCTLSAH